MNQTTSSFPPVSVVMPVFNMGKYVGEAIQSILTQTFTGFEFIIIDDGSNDNSWDVIRSFEDERIFAVKNDSNLGNYPSRNRGMRLARGKYIAVMDADDVAFPIRLRTQFDFMEENPDVLACGSAYQIMNSNKIKRYNCEYEKIKYNLIANLCMPHPTIMFRKDCLNNSSFYDEKFRYAADYDFICRLAMIGKIINLEEALLYRRFHDEQISKACFSEQDKYAREIQYEYQLKLGMNVQKLDRPFLAHLVLYLDAMQTFAPSGLFNGKMGVVIFFYLYSRHTDNPKYEKLAFGILSDIIDNLYNVTPVNLFSGLCGIGLGILFLLDRNYIEGDAGEILEEIDLKIASETFNNKENYSLETGIAGIICYVTVRKLFVANSADNDGIFDEEYLAKLKGMALEMVESDNLAYCKTTIKAFIDIMNKVPTVLKWEELFEIIIGSLPHHKEICRWPLGLQNGCAGVGLHLLNNLYIKSKEQD
jgi:glycosyltransferase involved in cell wall biosynthesis